MKTLTLLLIAAAIATAADPVYKVGDRVEAAPYGPGNKWYPCTITQVRMINATRVGAYGLSCQTEYGIKELGVPPDARSIRPDSGASRARIQGAVAQQQAVDARGPGGRYDTRNPTTCSSRNAPASGPIAPAQAALYIKCAMEGVQASSMRLLENLTVQVGRGRPFNYNIDINMPEVDATQLIYPLRGSFDDYFCYQISPGVHDRGRNCDLWHHPEAAGKCWKTSFGDWSCAMAATSFGTSPDHNQPPPPR